MSGAGTGVGGRAVGITGDVRVWVVDSHPSWLACTHAVIVRGIHAHANMPHTVSGLCVTAAMALHIGTIMAQGHDGWLPASSPAR